MEIKYIENGSVTSAKGFTANGICAGVKASNTTKKDLALIYCDKVCNSAAIFTKNLVKSDTIYVTKKHRERLRQDCTFSQPFHSRQGYRHLHCLNLRQPTP